jgi:hypothetical protein
VNIARSKLLGRSPTSILLEELGSNRWCGNDHFGSLSSIGAFVRAEDDVTANASEVQDVPSQVDELLRLATDPNILIRQWCGLMTWL